MGVEVGEGQLIGPELVQETTEKISQIKDRLKVARDRRPHSLHVRLPEELDGVHDTFHVSNLKKCLADPTLQVPLDEIQVDDKLNFIEELVEILEREFKKLKRSRIAIIKVWWNSKRGLEFTWEREDQMKLKSCADVVAFACVIEIWLLKTCLRVLVLLACTVFGIKGFGSCPNIVLQLVGPLGEVKDEYLGICDSRLRNYSPDHAENSPGKLENSPGHVENSHVNVENSLENYPE
ncbi:hypothetical protein Tco_0911187 [Tanacetum coccineum]|uniref:Reverse transcriptase domain-containing protein n=1 Tax=Tanacetum coccineum TaxID=301880 RepID=A0ABQ5CWH9_9ASTR